MPDYTGGVLLAVVSAVGSLALVIVGYVLKIVELRRTERRADQRAEQKRWIQDCQTIYLPLLGAARDLEERLVHLARIYRGDESSGFRPDSLSADFRELYLLSPAEIQDLYSADPNQPRRDLMAVQRLRTRMCRELNFATSSVYRTARYLAVAQSARRRVEEGRHGMPATATNDLRDGIIAVSAALQGPTGAGIPIEQQDSIGEMMRTADDQVITQFGFRQRLLELPGWEQYTALLTFFLTENDDRERYPIAARLAAKLDHEVRNTVTALRTLIDTLDRLTALTDPHQYRPPPLGGAGSPAPW